MKKINDNVDQNQKLEYDNIARARQGKDGGWHQQLLIDHLEGTARRAGEFAAAFGSRDWGELLGWWHDLGKFDPKWQDYIRRKTGYDPEAHIETEKGRPNHSTAGAIHAMLWLKQSLPSRILAYILAGHHAGLPDWEPGTIGGDLSGRLFQIDEQVRQNEIAWINEIPEARAVLVQEKPASPPLGITSGVEFQSGLEHFHLWLRMLFSCLVDADFLDTEAFMNETNAEERGCYKSIGELEKRFDLFIKRKEMNAEGSLNTTRKRIREQCVQKASLPPGFFSLMVPTGGGKTLSSMAFALRHALLHQKQRIVYAIPYTSIIEQTAKVFKYGSDISKEIEDLRITGDMLFGENQVVEHHSGIDPDRETSRNRLATENWDAPIIVTTNVQLFESLFAARTSSCRKLHNIANSIIILDEVQMLPPEYLKPILSVLRGLVTYFNVSVILMTATQPALEGHIGSGQAIVDGLKNVRPIIEDPDSLAHELDRVEISYPADFETASSWEKIRDELVNYEQVLCIVNTRKDCRELHAIMPEGTIHLSALMCAEERSNVISEIKEKLLAAKPIRVISTQLVEAGVDIDFPVVYRALAGFDSIAQAAGRCNRENKLAAQGQKGKVVVFIPPEPAPPGLLRKGEQACKDVLRSEKVDGLSPKLFIKYFQYFYGSLNEVDKPGFYADMVRDAQDFKFQFRTLAQKFHLIDEHFYQAVIVRYKNPYKEEEIEQLIGLLQKQGNQRRLLQKLQRYIVNVPIHDFLVMRARNLIEPVGGYWVQRDNGLYRPGIGLRLDSDFLRQTLIS